MSGPRDPRAFPERWRHHLRCSFGEISHAHILHEAMVGVDRVMACLSPIRPRSRRRGSRARGIRTILETATRIGGIDVAKLSTTAPLRQADWWPMAAAVVRPDRWKHPTSAAAWRKWAPGKRDARAAAPWRHPRPAPSASASGRICWQSRSQGVSRLAELLGRASLPDGATLRGDDPATLAELSTRICRDHPRTERIFQTPPIGGVLVLEMCFLPGLRRCVCRGGFHRCLRYLLVCLVRIPA